MAFRLFLKKDSIIDIWESSRLNIFPRNSKSSEVFSADDDNEDNDDGYKLFFWC